jgi:hypothetical protein
MNLQPAALSVASASRARPLSSPSSGRLPVSAGDLEAVLRERLTRASSGKSGADAAKETKDAKEAEGPDDAVMAALEARISTAQLTPRQKDMARRMVAVSLKNLDDPKHLPKIVNAINALVAAWEEANRGKKLEKEDPDEVKRIKDYLADYAEAEQAGSEAAQAGQSARSSSGDGAAEAAPAPVTEAPTVGGRLDVVA